MTRYYSIHRPVGLGTFPQPSGNRIITIANFDDREYIKSIDYQAWGYIEYEEPLTDKEANSYELIKEK